MTGRLSEVDERIGSVRQLKAVITAMRGIAAARAQEAKAHLAGIRAYAETVGGAIGDALALMPDVDGHVSGDAAAGRRLVIALSSEQGFVGTFNERVLDAAAKHLKGTEAAELFLVGDRGLMAASERDLDVSWSAPMAAHVDETQGLANRLADAVLKRLSAGVTAVTVVHAVPADGGGAVALVDRSLVPLDFDRFPVRARGIPPLVTQDPQTLIAQLADEYLFAELSEAIMLSFAAENEARMRAMIAARHNVDERLDDLTGLYRRLRQDEITDEIIELASGAAAGADAR
ncbi:F0F1 ATP synthase subunit gamma [Rhodobium gokarnense]|uniref:F-type H+-transporting ATPase subunit gamma n=1 Tax=Rhodobium gokarnense TaxID=364296 RepID=A0ABT3H6B0_9HYPH|nr:F0F1 ATP synthase subunit gamma [Rhodobium gokarnense]MCW2305914.1 F-type H+-transporting ATPase subunit gamma [Rhodobium gokarnense]